MNSKKINIIRITFLVLILIGTHSTYLLNQQNIKKGTLTFYTSNFESDEGQALINLFRIEDDMPKKPYKQGASKIVNHKATITFKDLAFGEYAAILVHDKNSNYIIDHSWGFPKEPLGFTNKWKLSLLSGMPNFNKLKFTFSESALNQYIKIQE